MSAAAINVIGMIAMALALMLRESILPTVGIDWTASFEYKDAEIYSIKVGEFGFPYLPVSIEDTTLFLPFDTGNMVGMSVTSNLFNKMDWTANDSYNRRNSAGKIIATLRVAKAVDVSVFGRKIGPVEVYEFNHPSLSGLVGPTSIGGGHFTLDYRTERMGLSYASLPDSVPGFVRLPLVRSRGHPMLILVSGRVEGRKVLIELDTGKSRTVINPTLVSELGLKRSLRGVVITSLQIGHLSFEVPGAKEVDQSGIDATLQEPILVGIGSDLLCHFVWTVDYETDSLWLPEAR